MGEINFISNDMDDGGKPAVKEPKKDVKPDKFVSSEELSASKGSSVFGIKKKDDSSENIERLEKSRQEVLEIIDKNKRNNKNSSAKSGFQEKNPKSSWFKRLFDGPGKSQKTESPQSKETQSAIKSPIPQAGAQVKDSPMIFNNNTWNSAGVLETNLIDKTDYSFFDTGKKIRALSAGFFASLFLVMSIYLAILYWEDMELNEISQTKTDIVKLEKEVSDLEQSTSEAKKFQERLDLAIKILDKHIYFSNFFKFLETKTLANVFYAKDIKMSADQPISLLARTDTYESVKNQLMILSNEEMISDLVLGNIKNYSETYLPKTNKLLTESDPIFGTASTSIEILPVTETGVEFDFEFNIDKNIYYTMSENPELESDVPVASEETNN